MYVCCIFIFQKKKKKHFLQYRTHSRPLFHNYFKTLIYIYLANGPINDTQVVIKNEKIQTIKVMFHSHNTTDNLNSKTFNLPE